MTVVLVGTLAMVAGVAGQAAQAWAAADHYTGGSPLLGRARLVPP